ncbi:MAG: UDP-galactopyranose mutase [Chthoniobacteraceae bacterium]
MSEQSYLVVGAGLAGSVLARELVSRSDCRVTIFEERPHLAGNCHTERDSRSGVMVHTYGPHIFNTDRADVWEYVNQFVSFGPFVNRVKAKIDRGVFSLPVNLQTINQFFGKCFNPKEARDFVASLGDKSIGEPANFEEQALKSLGRELYEAFFYGYTKKQWGCEPTELPASILKRLPVRFNYDDNYYNTTYQGIPREGYSEMVRRILEHERISVQLNARFEPTDRGKFDHVFYTGPIDAFFGFELGRLGYRTVTFERIDAVGDYQGNAVINYPGMEATHTRIHEHKHFTPWETHERTVTFREFSKETSPDDLPYYPKRLAPDLKLLRAYQNLAEKEVGVSFLGRLATYRYLNMDQVIGESLDFAGQFIASLSRGEKPPSFSQTPN